MKILFLGDIVGPSGCMVVKKHLKKIVEENKINNNYDQLISNTAKEIEEFVERVNLKN